MFVVLGAVWFLYFVPSFSKRSQEREAEHDELVAVRREAREIKTKLSSSRIKQSADAGARALGAKRLGSLVTFIGLGSGIWAATLLNSIEFAWAGVAGGFALAVAGVVLNRAANRSYRAAVSQSQSRRKSRPFVYSASYQTPAENASALRTNGLPDNSWQSPGVPSQIYRGSEGTVLPTQFAEVVELEAAKAPTLEAETLDEILRKRRANG
jgi:hypothetical protein